MYLTGKTPYLCEKCCRLLRHAWANAGHILLNPGVPMGNCCYMYQSVIMANADILPLQHGSG